MQDVVGSVEHASKHCTITGHVAKHAKTAKHYQLICKWTLLDLHCVDVDGVLCKTESLYKAVTKTLDRRMFKKQMQAELDTKYTDALLSFVLVVYKQRPATVSTIGE
jgi:hypothetical protein